MIKCLILSSSVAFALISSITHLSFRDSVPPQSAFQIFQSDHWRDSVDRELRINRHGREWNGRAQIPAHQSIDSGTVRDISDAVLGYREPEAARSKNVSSSYSLS